MNINITDILTFQAKKTSDSIAIITKKYQITFGVLEKYVWKLSTYLYKKDIRKDNVVIILFENELLHAITILSVARIGATVFSLPLNISKEFLLENIDRTNASFIASDRLNNISSLTHIKINQNILYRNTIIDYSVYCSNPKAPWQIILGSGSTGKKKFIPVSHKEEHTMIGFYINSEPIIKSSDRIASFVPISYAHGKRRLIHSIFAGASYIILPKETLKKPIEVLKNFRISILYATVFHIEKVLQSIPLNRDKVLDCIKISLSASFISMELRKRIKLLLTDHLIVRYGTNECNPICVSSLDNVYLVDRTVGKPIKGIIIEIVDNNGNKKAINDIGLIRIKSPCMFTGYLDEEVISSKVLKDNWFYPGDIGKLKEDGQLIHMGRADDMMIINGINIYPIEIEQAMLSHPEVNDAKALPLKSKVNQDIPVCSVSLKKDSKENEKSLLRYVSKKLGNNNLKRIFIMDSIARTDAGKIIKNELVEQIKNLIYNS